MRISIPKLKFKKDLDRLILLHWGHLLCFLAALFGKILYGINHWGSGLLKMMLLLVVYQFFFRTLRNLFYTFWTFSVFIAIYFIVIMCQAYFLEGAPVVGYFCALALFFLIWECYLLSSPIYYPLVHWWEYDFRYRHDLKIEINHEGMSFPGRLTDLRRGAGCIVSFDDFPSRKNLSIKTVLKHTDSHIDHIILIGELMSKRGNSIGRGFIYGVHFILKNEQEKKAYKTLMQYWRRERSMRMRSKFTQKKKPEVIAS